MEQCSLSQHIDRFISFGQWSPKLTDDENIENILNSFSSSGNTNVLRFLIVNIIETKITNGEYACENIE